MIRTSIVVLTLFLQLVLSSPYLVTQYVNIKTSTIVPATVFSAISVTQTEILRTLTQEIVPTVTPVPTINAKTSVITSNEYGVVTVVEVDVPLAAGKTLSRFGGPDTSYYVGLTYSKCASVSATQVTAVVYVPSVVEGKLSPITAATSFRSYDTARATPIVSALVKAEDIDPKALSSLSFQNQPYGCTDAPEPRSTIQPDSSGHCSNGHNATSTRCGDNNPCCVSCTFYTEYCIGTCPRVPRSYWQCRSGIKYYKGSNGEDSSAGGSSGDGSSAPGNGSSARLLASGF